MSNFLRNIHPLLRTTKRGTNDSNYAVLSTIDRLLSEVEEETIKERIQSSLKTATGTYLDEWGSWFGVYRKNENEPDEDYRLKIVEALNIPRGTNESIKLAIRRFLEDSTVSVNVYEPWMDTFTLNKSLLNGSHRMLGDYYNIAVIDVIVGRFDLIEGMSYETIFKEIVDVIHDYKPAGVTLHFTYDPSLGPITGSEDGLIPYGVTSVLEPEITADIHTTPNEYLWGEFKLSQAEYYDKIFEVNKSNINSEDVLSGDFNQRHPNIHLVSKSTGFKPTNSTLIGQVKYGTIDVSDKFYEVVDNKDNNVVPVTLNRQEQLMITYNAGKVLQLEHPSIKRSKETYSKILEGSKVSITFKTSIQGSLIHLEAYNFDSRAWEPLVSKVSSEGEITLEGHVNGFKQYLSDNLLVFIRVRPTRDVSIEVNRVNFNYKNKEVQLADKRLGKTKVIPTEVFMARRNLIRNSDRIFNNIFGASKPSQTLLTHFLTVDKFSDFNFSDGEHIIFSAEIEILGSGFSGNMRFQTREGYWVNLISPYEITKEETIKLIGTPIEITDDFNNPRLNAIQIRLDNVPETVQVKINKVKLEKGSTATPWTPAPEDENNTYTDEEGEIIGNND